jgi:hypothetical protein
VARSAKPDFVGYMNNLGLPHPTLNEDRGTRQSSLRFSTPTDTSSPTPQ